MPHLYQFLKRNIIKPLYIPIPNPITRSRDNHNLKWDSYYSYTCFYSVMPMYASMENTHSLHISKHKLCDILLKLAFSFLSSGWATITGCSISHYVYNLLGHFPGHGHLGWLWFLLLTTRCCMNILVYIFLWTCESFLRCDIVENMY